MPQAMAGFNACIFVASTDFREMLMYLMHIIRILLHCFVSFYELKALGTSLCFYW